MAQQLVPINLPIRLQCLRVPARWKYEITRWKDGTEMIWFSASGGKNETATPFDAWEKRADFFRLREGDSDALRDFLDGVGLFTSASIEGAIAAGAEVGKTAKFLPLDNFRWVDAEDGRHRVWGDFQPLSADVIWATRREAIREMEKPKLHLGFDVLDLSLRLAALRSGPAAVITTFAFSDALAASVRIDHLQRAKIRRCQRPDCGIPFAAVGPRKRKFCGWYCGHIVSVRKIRAKHRQKRKRGAR